MAARIGPTASSAAVSSPRSLKFTSTERPSLETWPSLPFAYGDSMSYAAFDVEIALIVSSTAARTDGSVALAPFGAWRMTLSTFCVGLCASTSSCALPESPT